MSTPLTRELLQENYDNYYQNSDGEGAVVLDDCALSQYLIEAGFHPECVIEQSSQPNTILIVFGYNTPDDVAEILVVIANYHNTKLVMTKSEHTMYDRIRAFQGLSVNEINK